ncbi:MAG: exosortase A [Novosphingobium sp.]
MPREAVLPCARARWVSLPEHWRRPALYLACAWIVSIAVFASDWLAMADHWWNSSTYNHILLVPVIIGWLIWQRLPDLLQLQPRPWAGGLVPLALALLGWVLGSFSGFDLLRQAGAVATLPSLALLVLGPRVFSAVLFPMCYMGFLVPFGDELVPPLQTITAKLTIALVGISGIPATINGVFIDTPAGLFEVAEACSGVKFLIAMIALGALVANVGFRSWGRRSVFMLLCIVVPILANGVRAWGTIYAAQHVGIEKAAGIDHLIYGWIFFALVIAAVIGISWRFFDRSIDEPMIDAEKIAAQSAFERFERSSPSLKRLSGAAALLLAAALAWSAAAQNLAARLPQQVFLPGVPGWTRIDYAPQAPWAPRANGAKHRLLGSYSDESGRKVDVFYALYDAQRDGAEAGGFGEGALRPDSGWSWADNIPAPDGGMGERLVYMGATERLAWTWYRSGKTLTGSNARLKLATIGDRLLLRARPTEVLILSSEKSGTADPAGVLDQFENAVGDVGLWMDHIGKGG